MPIADIEHLHLLCRALRDQLDAYTREPLLKNGGLWYPGEHQARTERRRLDGHVLRPEVAAQGKNWLATIPDKGFVIFRLYGPKQAFYDRATGHREGEVTLGCRYGW